MTATTKPTGGPAFPTVIAQGQSLRDWFAGQALTGILSGALADGSHLGPDSPRDFATTAYAMADAMIAERAKP